MLATNTELWDRIVQALTSGSLNDITREQMNRIVRKLKRLPPGERRTGVKVGKVLVEELGVQKANQYVEQSLSQGLITSQEYDELKAAVTLHVPREKLPPSWAGRGRQELLEAQRRIQQDFERLSEQGKKTMEAPMRAFTKDVERLKKSWGR